MFPNRKLTSLKVLISFLLLQSVFARPADGPSGSVCPEPEYVSEKKHKSSFVRISPTSKFLIPKETIRVPPKNAIQICEGMGLQPAVMSWSKDYWEIVNSIKTRKQNTDLFLTGAIHNASTPGDYFNTNTKDRMKFQLFELDQKIYFQKGLNCLILNCTKGECSFVPQPCTGVLKAPPTKANAPPKLFSPVVPLCQYKDDSECAKNIAQTEVAKDGKVDEDYFIPLNKTKTASLYFGSKHQKCWKGALEACKKIGMKLLYFDKKQPQEMSEIMKVIKEYSLKLDLPYWATYSWTSGQFVGEYGPGKWFHFEGSEDLWRFEENLGRWEWPDSSLVTKPKHELCMSVVSTETKVVRPLLCSLPNYFICRTDESHAQGGQTGRSFDLFQNMLNMFFGNQHQQQRNNGSISSNKRGKGPAPYAAKCKPSQTGRSFKKKNPEDSKKGSKGSKTVMAQDANANMNFNFGGANYAGLPDCPDNEPPKTTDVHTKKPKVKPPPKDKDAEYEESATVEETSSETFTPQGKESNQKDEKQTDEEDENEEGDEVSSGPSKEDKAATSAPQLAEGGTKESDKEENKKGAEASNSDQVLVVKENLDGAEPRKGRAIASRSSKESEEIELGAKKSRPSGPTTTSKPGTTRKPEKILDDSQEIEIGAKGPPRPKPITRTSRPLPKEKAALDASKELELGATARPKIRPTEIPKTTEQPGPAEPTTEAPSWNN